MDRRRLIEVIEAADPALRNSALEDHCATATLAEIAAAAEELDRYRRTATNLYFRVRALFFLHAIHRYHTPRFSELQVRGRIPYAGYEHLLQRRFDDALDAFLAEQAAHGPSEAIASALAEAYRGLAFQTLADQVRRSVRSTHGNEWMFAVRSPEEHPLRLRPELTADHRGAHPVLCEHTPVRMDLTHSGWSDIFFLGMDHPEGARVLNVSIDLAVVGRDPEPTPPISSYLRVIDEPVLRLRSIDLDTERDYTSLHEIFAFAADYLGLLKGAVIAAGLIPPGLEDSGVELADVLAAVCGPGRGLEITSHVRGIPKGSRLAVSTNLLASLIGVCMRATGQTESITGSLTEEERRLTAARAILGEWLGGSGGGWQDSGGLWPGIKLITGQTAAPGDPEHEVSRGCLLPRHEVLGPDRVSPAIRDRLQRSLVLVHGGLAQNVGPILEMVTEKYLLRSPREWAARADSHALFDEIVEALHQGDIHRLASATTRHVAGPIRTIIPQATDAFTTAVIERLERRYGEAYWGFCMLGGMTGGGMGFWFDPAARDEAVRGVHEVLSEVHAELCQSLPFAMRPVVYDFAINAHGTTAELLTGSEALVPTALERHDATPSGEVADDDLEQLLDRQGFDPRLHEQIRTDLRAGTIGLAQNRLAPTVEVEDTGPEDTFDALRVDAADEDAGRAAMAGGRVAVVTLAAGAGTRWTQGAGVVKALHPFASLAGRHRSFLEVHLAKSARSAREHAALIPHVFTTSFSTNDPIAAHLERHHNHGYGGPVILSPGRAVGLRMIPTVRDLRFAWEEMPQQVLDEQAQKVRASQQAALIAWASEQGEATDYTDNLAAQCLHPVGHWFEIPNMLRNGVLAGLLERHPDLELLLLHNIDTLGAWLDPALIGRHLRSGAALTFEVVRRRVEDQGGGLARVDGTPRIVESLALPSDEDELRLSYYNSMTTWISISHLLDAFGLERGQLGDRDAVDAAVRRLGAEIPTYITLKEVKKRWGHAQEDVFPISQFEKLWSDMSALPELACQFAVVPRERGQQLKDPAQLDGWLRDGSADYVTGLCAFGESTA